LVSDLEPDDRTWVFRSLDAPAASNVFAYVGLDTQEQLVESLPAGELAKILNGMPADDRTTLLSVLREERTQRLLSLLTPDERKIA
jgi:magnesium transporter